MEGPFKRLLKEGLIRQSFDYDFTLHYENVVKVEIDTLNSVVYVYFPDGNYEQVGSVDEWKITPSGLAKVRRIYGSISGKPRVIRVFANEGQYFTVEFRVERSESSPVWKAEKCIIK
jgi:hypothetical protein